MLASETSRRASLLAAGLAVLLVALAAVAFLSVAYGSRSISLAEVWRALTDMNVSSTSGAVTIEMRVPRTLLGILAGTALGASGAIGFALVLRSRAGPP